MLDFWDTVSGTRLADTLITCLPKLTKEKKQETMVVDAIAAAETVAVEIKKGRRYVDRIPAGNKVLLIFEN